MADISAFPTIRAVIESGNNIGNYTAGAAIKAGQVVSIHATGVSRTVHPSVKGTTGLPIGVALYGVANGEKLAVAEDGCKCYIANADDTTGLDAGDPVEDNDNAVGGTVSALALSETGAVAVAKYCVGFAIDDIAGGGTGVIKIKCGIITAVNTA